jgi:hypothetical protein
MDILSTSEFNAEISTSSSAYIIHSIWRNEEAFELMIEEPNGKTASYSYQAGKLIPQNREIARHEKFFVGRLPWVAEVPVYPAVSREIEQTAVDAVEAFLRWERESQVNQP